jgi:serine/threonine-protein kinase
MNGLVTPSQVTEKNKMHDFETLKTIFSNLKLLAQGGQKRVYSGTHPQYGAIVLKLFFTNDLRSQREISISENISFDCVPMIFETGEVNYEGAEVLYVIEQRINGEELRDKLDRGERFTLNKAVHFLEQGLSFICELEKNNIVHRDIKPENIIVSANDKVFFLDFGIARILGTQSLTKTDAIAGPHTPGYAAPEQFNNLKSEIDSRADLFSLGVVVYECLSGTNPFRENARSHLDILQRTETVTPIKFQISGDTQQQFMGILSSMMGKYPSRRPKNAEQAIGWLNAAKNTFQYEGE